MQLIDDQKRQIQRYFQSRPEIAAVYLCGSQAQGRAGELSDVDLGVLLKNEVDREKNSGLQLEYIGAVQVVPGLLPGVAGLFCGYGAKNQEGNVCHWIKIG